jgi:hypothetical protein
MHTAWGADADEPVQRFWKRLIRERAVDFMQSPVYLKPLRYDYERARRDQARFGHIWAEHGTNVYKLIAGAYGENWDAEDDEKQRYALEHKEKGCSGKANSDHGNLARTREEGPRERRHPVQGFPEARERLVEEGQGQQQQKGC